MAKPQMKRISQEVLDALASGYMENGLFQLAPLANGMYPKVKKVLNDLGIIWKTNLKGHICPDGDDPMERIEDALQTGTYEKPNRHEFFETPIPVIARMMEYAELGPGLSVLEPSAGNGAIARLARDRVGSLHILVCEIDPIRADALKADGFNVHTGDFLQSECFGQFHRVMMNPPFRHEADIDHVLCAWGHVAPGGRLISVMSSMTEARKTKKAIAFRALLDDVGFMEELPDDSFKESGTLVKTVLVVMDKSS